MKKKTSKPKIVVRYFGTAEVNVYAAGEAVVHTVLTKSKTIEKVISVRGGPVVMDTLPPLEMKAVHGTCIVKIAGGATKTLKPGKKLTVPNGETFTLESEGAVLLCTSLYGPGLVPPWPGGDHP